MVVGLDQLGELFRPELQQRSQDFVVAADACAFQSLRQKIFIGEVVGVPENAYADLFARFPREFSGHCFAKRRYLFALQKKARLQRPAALQQLREALLLPSLLRFCFLQAYDALLKIEANTGTLVRLLMHLLQLRKLGRVLRMDFPQLGAYLFAHPDSGLKRRRGIRQVFHRAGERFLKVGLLSLEELRIGGIQFGELRAARLFDARLESLRFALQRTKRLKKVIGALPLLRIPLLLRQGLVVGRRRPAFIGGLKRSEARPHIAKFLDAFAQVADRPPRSPDLIGTGFEGSLVFSQRKVNGR